MAFSVKTDVLKGIESKAKERSCRLENKYSVLNVPIRLHRAK